MRINVRMSCAAVVAVLLMSTLALRAEGAAKTSMEGKESASADGRLGFGVDPAAPMAAAGQVMTKDGKRPLKNGAPRVELFLGFSHLRAVPSMESGNRFVWLNGGSTSLAINFNRYLGLVGDFGGYADSRLRLNGSTSVPATEVDSSGKAFSYMLGPRVSFRNHRITPFVQALFGAVHASEVTVSSGCTSGACTPLPEENKFALAAGVGLDVRIHRHLSIRLVQAEYFMTQFDDLTTGKSANQNDMRLSTGLVFRFGGQRERVSAPPLSYSCSVNPSGVFAGESVAVMGSAGNLNSANIAVYTWSADGGVVSGNSSTASIDTRDLKEGTYTVKGHISEGNKPDQNADCSAVFTRISGFT